MGRFVEGEERRQSLLLPESLDDYVTDDNPVRVIEAFIDELDLGALGFEGVRPAAIHRLDRALNRDGICLPGSRDRREVTFQVQPRGPLIPL